MNSNDMDWCGKAYCNIKTTAPKLDMFTHAYIYDINNWGPRGFVYTFYLSYTSTVSKKITNYYIWKYAYNVLVGRVQR